MIIDVILHVRDVIFPTEQPYTANEKRLAIERSSKSSNEWAERTASLPADEEFLTELYSECKGMLTEERLRQQSVDARLTTIIGLFSIVGTIVFGTILTVDLHPHSFLSVLVFISCWYLFFQLISALLAAVRGLERRQYETMSDADLLPKNTQSPSYHRRHQIEQFYSILTQNETENNAKLTQLAVAHRAIKNFVFGLVVFSVLSTVQHTLMPEPDELISRLKSDHVLLSLIRGPQGPPGPPGPVGPSSPAGIIGSKRARSGSP